MDTLRSELSQINSALAAHESEVKRMGREVECRDAVIADLNVKLNSAKAETASTLSEFSDNREEFDSKVSSLALQIKLLEASLLDSRKTADLYASTMARLVDPVTGVQHRCPVIQNNGVIRSLGAVIDIWVKESDMGQSNAFRMFSCPVTREFVILSPIPIVNALMKLAGAAGVNTRLPIVFMHKGMDGAWAEFSFHEQLELIARLCSVYKDRKDPTKPPAQLSIPAGLILMRSVVYGAGVRLECFGMQNDGKGKVEIKLVFDPEWAHPFIDMDFASGA
jgi:hypothetical protein